MAFFPQGIINVKTLLAIIFLLLFTITASARVTDWEDLVALSIALYQQGEYADALKVMKKSIEVAKETFGPHHHTVSLSMKNLAMLYSIGGNYSEAESLYKKALSLDENILGRDHIFIADDLKAMAELYMYQGRDREAESLYLRAHEIEEEIPTREPMNDRKHLSLKKE